MEKYTSKAINQFWITSTPLFRFFVDIMSKLSANIVFSLTEIMVFLRCMMLNWYFYILILDSLLNHFNLAN
jgi:hypothetical protein